MSNEVVDLKLNGTGGEATKSAQPEVQEQENIEGSFRYDSLKDADVNNLVSDSRPTLITLFGVSECGKTTFVGSLFAILRRRPCLLKKTFIDSDTLTGFERRVHQRFLSEDGQSVIQRTQRKAGSILNVVLGNEQGNNQHMFVISDLSGEIYWDAISDITIVQQQKAVKYADKLVIFADIEPLLKAKSYNSYKENFQSLLARFKENDMLPVGAEVYVALNKSDMVESAAIDASKTLLMLGGSLFRSLFCPGCSLLCLLHSFFRLLWGRRLLLRRGLLRGSRLIGLVELLGFFNVYTVLKKLQHLLGVVGYKLYYKPVGFDLVVRLVCVKVSRHR